MFCKKRRFTYGYFYYCFVLVITAIVLISRNKPVIDYSATNNSLALLDQKLDINSKQSGEAFRSISEQMHGLTEKNYEQMLKINESLNDNAERQTKRIS